MIWNWCCFSFSIIGIQLKSTVAIVTLLGVGTSSGLVALVSDGVVMVPVVGQQVAPIVGAPANLAGNLYNARGRGKVFLGSPPGEILTRGSQGVPRGSQEVPRWGGEQMVYTVETTHMFRLRYPPCPAVCVKT